MFQDPYASFIPRRGHKNGEGSNNGKQVYSGQDTRVNRWGRSMVNVIQGSKQREIIQVHSNSPARGKQSPNDATKG